MKTEVTAKVRRIAPTQTFRGIAGDVFTRGDPNCCLGAKTFVYGRNGTGKTTFSELLRQADDDNISIKAEYFENGKWRQGEIPDTVVSRIHVFNRYYVDQHLGFFLDGSGSSAGILKLGQVNVDAEAARHELEQEVERQRLRLAAVTTSKSRLEACVKELRQAAKQRAIDVLKRSLPLKYGTQTFTVAKADKALLASPGVTLTDEQQMAARELLESEVFEALPLPQHPIDASTLSGRVGESVARELRSRVRPELANNQLLADWIEAGLALHPAGEDQCKFCTVGTLPPEIRAAYEAHFDISLMSLRSDLQQLKNEIDGAALNLNEWRATLPEQGALMPNQRAEYSQARDGLKEPLDAWLSFLAALGDLVARRLSDPHQVVVEPVPSSPSPLDLTALTRVTAAHNSDVTRQASLREQAERDLLNDLLEQYRPEYLTAQRRIPLADRVVRQLQDRIEHLQLVAAQSRDQQADVGRMAELINDDLANSLGHVHLSLRVTDDGKGYRVLRSNGPAQDLSEGERNSLALLYFLRSLEAEGVRPEHDLVVVDDPVTSLDKDSMFASYSLVDERTKNFGQLIVLTHDYELFRLFLMRYRKVLNASRRQINEGDTQETKFPRIQFLETRAQELPSGKRGIAIRPMPERLLTQPTDYHYIFHRIAEAVRLKDDTDLPLLGNAARRLLEGFVAFKSPSGGDFQSKIEHAAQQAGIPAELTQRIVRFVHGASHRDEPNPSVTFDSANVPDELGQVLRFIRSCDLDHFKGMCKAVDVDLTSSIKTWDKQRYAESKALEPPNPAEGPSETAPDSVSRDTDQNDEPEQLGASDTLPI